MRLHMGNCPGSESPERNIGGSIEIFKEQNQKLEVTQKQLRLKRLRQNKRGRKQTINNLQGISGDAATFTENPRLPYGIRQCRTSVSRARQLRGEKRSCGQTREYQSDQTSHKSAPSLLMPWNYTETRNPLKKGHGEYFFS